MLSTGQVVNNRYRVARLLGQGGMGAVYRAWDLSLNIPAALKEMIPQPGINSHALAQLRVQFQREAQVLAGLLHPSLPRVTDFFEWGGNAYLVMDFVQGESLEQIIERHGALPEAQVVQWAAQLLDALAACHACRVLHRDIKPQNIIIRPDGRAVLVDFGLVKLWDPNHPQTQHIVRGMGTPEYASPEHFRLTGRHTEPRSDLYSLGATLYHALTGREPPLAFDRWTNPAISLDLRASPPIRTAVLQALAFDPEQRFSSAGEMRAALQGAFTTPTHEPADVLVRGDLVGRARLSPIARDARWVIEMTTAAAMALVGFLVLQIALFWDSSNLGMHVGMGVWAFILGGVGWFLGDLIFQALARSEQVAVTPGGKRPTQRLVAFTRRVARRLTLGQQIALLGLLLVCTVVLVWILTPLVAQLRIPYVAAYMGRSYALIGPLAYAATGRRPGRALAAHTLVVTIAAPLLGARLGFHMDVGATFLASAGGGLLMEGIAFLSERTLLRRQA